MSVRELQAGRPDRSLNAGGLVVLLVAVATFAAGIAGAAAHLT